MELSSMKQILPPSSTSNSSLPPSLNDEYHSSSFFHSTVFLTVPPLLFAAIGFFLAKPFYQPPTPPGLACTLEAKLCPDGNAVGRTGPNCEFAECPTGSSTDSNFPNDWKTYIGSQPLTLRDLQFTPPEGWLYKSGINEYLAIEAYVLKPQEPVEGFPGFEIKAEIKKATLNELKESLLNIWRSDLDNPQVNNIRIKNLPGIQVIAKAKLTPNSPFKAGETVQFTAFVHQDVSYIFMSNVSTYQKEYDQILSTFKFTDNNCPQGQELKTCKLGPCCCPINAMCD